MTRRHAKGSGATQISAAGRAESEADTRGDGEGSCWTLPWPDAACLIAANGRFRDCNPAFTEELKWTAEELRRFSMADLFEPANLHSLPAQDEPWQQPQCEGTLRCGDGSWRRLKWRSARLGDGALLLTARIVEDTGVDTTRLRESLDLYRSIVDKGADCLAIIAGDGRILYANEAFLTRIATQGSVPTDALWDDLWLQPERATEAREIALALGTARFVERPAEDPSESMWWDVVVQPLSLQAHSQPLLLTVARDVSERQDLGMRAQRLASDLAFKVKQHQRALAELHQKEEELRALVENIQSCVICLDARGVVRSANPASLTILGKAPAELIGQPLRGFFSLQNSRRVDLPTLLQQAVEAGQTREIGWQSDGRQSRLEVSVGSYKAGGECFHIVSLTDVTERQRLIDDLNRARRDAEQANLAKSSFLAAMSHEIRTPMNGVVGMIDLLAHTALDDVQSDAVATARESAFSLLALIDDVLDFSKIEAERMEIESEPVDIRGLAESVCDSLSTMARDRQVEIFLYVDPACPAPITTDPTRVRQILFNLLSNSIKFSAGSESRPGRVALRIEPEEHHPGSLRIAVVDNGIGMSEETLGSLFNAFQQAEASTTRRFGGSGLGLAICKRLIGLMGGSIEVVSRLNVGSAFTVRLPYPDAPTGGEEARPLEGIRCAIRGGSNIDRDDYRAYLSHAGATVIADSDAEEDLDMAQAQVLIHGVRLDQDWQAAMADARNLAPQARLLMVTRGRRRKPRVEAPSVVTLDGDVLRRDALVQAVRVAFDGSATAPSAAARPAIRTTAAEALGLTEARVRGRLVLVAEDDAINQKVLLRQLQLLGMAAEVAGDGVEALDLWRQGSYALLISDLHMPQMDGYKLIRTIRREEPAGTRMPAIALTANAMRGESATALAAGMDRYLTKPIQLAELGRNIAALLPEVSQNELPEAALAPAHSVFDPTTLSALVGDDPETLTGLLGEFLTSSGGCLDEMQRAAAEHDEGSVAAAAHRLKSSARAVGAMEVGDLCAQMENAHTTGDLAAVHHGLAQVGAALAEVHQSISQYLAHHSWVVGGPSGERND